MTKREHIIACAELQIGTLEEPKDSNKIKYNNWFYESDHAYYKNPKPWAYCGVFCAYVYHFADCPMEDGLKACIAYVPSAQNWLQKFEKETLEPKPGDLCIFDFNQDGFEEHIGLFHSWYDDSRQYAWIIEGNTSSGNTGSQDDGGGVYKRKRHKSLIEGFYNVLDD